MITYTKTKPEVSFDTKIKKKLELTASLRQLISEDIIVDNDGF